MKCPKCGQDTFFARKSKKDDLFISSEVKGMYAYTISCDYCRYWERWAEEYILVEKIMLNFRGKRTKIPANTVKNRRIRYFCPKCHNLMQFRTLHQTHTYRRVKCEDCGFMDELPESEWDKYSEEILHAQSEK